MNKKIMAAVALSSALVMAAPFWAYAGEITASPVVSNEEAEIKMLIDNIFADENAEAEASRGLIAYALWELSGEGTVNYIMPFSDVEEGSKYSEAIRWAASENIISGNGEGKFNPDGIITREQFASILYRYISKVNSDYVKIGEDTNILSYEDAFEISPYAVSAVQYACGAGIFEDYGSGEIRPKDAVTKKEAANMLVKAVMPEKDETIARVTGENISIIYRGGNEFEINSGTNKIREHWNCLTDINHRPSMTFTDVNGDGKNEICIFMTVSDGRSEHIEGIAVYDKDTLEELFVPALPEMLEGVISYSADNKKCVITLKAMSYEIENDGEYGYINFSNNTSFGIENGNIVAVSKLSKGDYNYCGSLKVTYKAVDGGFIGDKIEFLR